MLRRADSEDIPRISEIRLGVSENRLRDPTSIPPSMVAEFIDLHGHIWVWEERGRIAGFSAADLRDGSIWALFVEQPYEGLGIGRKLLDAACRSLATAGHVRAHLTTGIGTRAERFYRRDGWTEFDRKREIHFEKAI